nr:rcc01693 family protein [Mesorhizobium composti]
MAFPWEEAMAVGFGLLRLSPEVFWAMTPVEFGHAVRVRSPGRGPVPLRADLVALMRAFPDRSEKEA